MFHWKLHPVGAIFSNNSVQKRPIYQRVIMKRLYTILNNYCILLVMPPCLLDEATSFAYTNLGLCLKVHLMISEECQLFILLYISAQFANDLLWHYTFCITCIFSKCTDPLFCNQNVDIHVINEVPVICMINVPSCVKPYCSPNCLLFCKTKNGH